MAAAGQVSDAATNDPTNPLGPDSRCRAVKTGATGAGRPGTTQWACSRRGNPLRRLRADHAPHGLWRRNRPGNQWQDRRPRRRPGAKRHLMDLALALLSLNRVAQPGGKDSYKSTRRRLLAKNAL